MTSIINTITRMRPKLALLCALMLACCCLAVPAQAEYVTNDALHLGIISVATNRVNPLTPVEREFMSVTNLMYEGLMSIDDEYKPQYCLAERYSYTNSGKTWFFYLRDGVTFHDGTPLTAHDVVATVQEILRLAKDDSSTNKGRYSTLQYFIKSIEASDNKTVVITTNRNNYGFLYAMTFPILKADEVQADNPVGTGPYYLDMYDFSSYLLLSCYTGWWQNLPDYRQVLVSLYSTNRELISGYEYSNVDAILTRAITAAQYRTGVTSYNIDYRTTQLETLMMNNGSYELKDVRVRQAIRYMLDLDDIVNNVYYGMVTRTDTPLIPGTWTYWSENDAQQFNKQRAMELLDEAGWTDYDENGVRTTVRADTGKLARMHLRFYVYEEQENSVRVEVANRIADALMQVGIECKVETLTYKEARDKLKAGSYDLCLAAFNIDFTPDPGYLLISGNNCNYMRYKSTEMDNLFKTLRAAQEESAYRAALQSIQTLFWNDCPFVCLYYRNGSVLTRKMFTDARDVREPEVLRGIETFKK